MSDTTDPPPADGPALHALRQHHQTTPPDSLEPFDLVVAGGGFAGICAAVTAARHGLRTALIHDRPILGGMASSDVRVGPIGQVDHPPFPRNADVVRQLDSGIPSSGGVRQSHNDEQILALVRAEPLLTCLPETHLHAVDLHHERITSVHVRNLRTGHTSRLTGTFFADCTGDAHLGLLAGAEWRSGRESRSDTGESLAPITADRQVLGNTNYWRCINEPEPVGFPACPWALPIHSDADFEVSLPKWPVKIQDMPFVGGWNWESGFFQDAATEAEAIRDHNLRAIFGTWDWLKNRSPRRHELANARLEWIGHILGKRESRRLMGDHILTQHDLEQGRSYPDGCVTATWYFDLHFPHPENAARFPGQEFRSMAYDDPHFEQLRGAIPGKYTPIKPYAIPFRCLYSRTVPNLFMAGRNISVTHVALAPVRTQMTTGMMGTVVGRAAWLCQFLGVEPRGLYTDHLARLLQVLADPECEPASL
ncbi:MAG: FAD-dependent oxidoreductase [Planctomycetota bacterium]|nr:FAD-dependent oxidoreductase [Planctomycetota bacterium]